MKVAVIGSGSWGTALSQVLSDAGNDVCIWTRSQDTADIINKTHRNPKYLTDYTLSDRVRASADFEEVFASAEACVLVTPSKYLRETATNMKEQVASNLPIIICSKGTEAATGLLPTDVVASVLGNPNRIAVLSGPTHAEEVIGKIPSGAVIASSDESTSLFFQKLFATDYFRTYRSSDTVGVELCAAFKNVIAIAVGISYGLGMGDDTAAMLITRGLAEMNRMVVACGGQSITCMGLAGAGDMVVTCMSRHSRNRRFGQDYVACGKTLEDFERDTHMVVEGAQACKTLEVLSKKNNVELPLTDAIRSIVWEGASPKEVADHLIERPLKEEF